MAECQGKDKRDMTEIPKEWLSVMEKLGRERTVKMIKNGTSLKVAEEMIKWKDKLKISI